MAKKKHAHRPAKAHAQKPRRSPRRIADAGPSSHRERPVVAPPQRGFDLAAVTVDATTEARALAELPLTRRLEALLGWVRPGRGVTASGALRRADLTETARIVGVELRPLGEQEAAVTPDVKPGTLVMPMFSGVWRNDDGPRLDLHPVYVMRDVIALDRAWRTCQDLGVLDVGKTRVRLSEEGVAWLDGDAQQRHEWQRRAAVAYLTRVLTVDFHRIPVFKNLMGRFTSQELLALLVTGPRPAHGRSMGFGLASGEMERLAAQGIVQVGAVDRITRGLEAVVAEALIAYREHAGEDG